MSRGVSLPELIAVALLAVTLLMLAASRPAPFKPRRDPGAFTAFLGYVAVFVFTAAVLSQCAVWVADLLPT